ncbi:MAG TPA: S8 family serine peptidase [Caldimonas sp.]|nr:S8 family serine peptidase [Caldimonas sp.]HEX2539928.1 S8 family serine peptidase [Caldimonas sp.]
MKNLSTSTAALVAALLLVSCGGGDSPVDPAGQASAESASRSRSFAQAAPRSTATSRQVPAALRQAGSRLDARLRRATGPVQVWVALEQESVAAQRATLAEASGLAATETAAIKSSPALRQSSADHRQRVREAQTSLAGRIASLGGSELARVQVAHNAIAVRIDAAQLAPLAALEGVASVRPVLDYQMTLAETVPYVGAAAVQASGRDGSGVVVAVLDSGIDYTHRNLGGPGTTAAYAAAYGANAASPANKTPDGLFPTAKVIAGFDFVGETWASGADALVPDPDPIDANGHGTHVADIIAGRSLDGAHRGMAPGAKLVAVKVCSAVSTGCSGIAMLQGLDFALDPDGDGDTSDAVDVINMSIGTPYGQIEDDVALAAGNAVKLGVVVVTSAGNSANKPYVVGSPSLEPGVISVAQTAVPSARVFPLVVNAPASIAGVYGNTATVDWAPVGAGVTGDVVYIGRACPAGAIGAGSPADPLLANPAGKIALVDRGSCSVSPKVDVATKAGAIGVLVGLIAPGDAVSFSYGGGGPFAPTLVIQQSLSSAIKARLAANETVNATFGPGAAIALVGGIVSSSSRGPSSTQAIKPEIGAPGGSVSAVAGTGSGQEAFSGTSGAAPMVAGAAALLVQAYPNRPPVKIKAMLMNSAQTAVYTNPALLPGELAPVSRIGAGELRVDRAIALTSAAWSPQAKSAALSFGALEVAAPMVVERTLRIQNFADVDRTFRITPSFRYDADAATGAVQVLARSQVRVAARSTEEIEVRLRIDPSKLPSWTFEGGFQGGDGAALNGPEFDGYLTLTSGSERLSVPWHVLPRRAAELATTVAQTRQGDVLRLRNRGAETGVYDVFSLTGVSSKSPRSELPQPGDNFALIDLRAVGVRYLPNALTGLGVDVLEFAFDTSSRRPHPAYPGGFEVQVDTNGDGSPDYFVFNTEAGGFAMTGQTLVAVQAANAATSAAFFYADADLNSGNMIFTVPLNIGTGSIALSPGATIGFTVLAFDNYFTGQVTDAIEGMRFTPGTARFGVVGVPFGGVPAHGNATLGVTTATLPNAKSSELGLLMMYRRDAGDEADALRLR